MKVNIAPGKYVVAVSGGVDSTALLHLLAQQSQVTGNRLQVTDKKRKISNLQPLTSNLELIVAHFDHGIRQDGAKDEQLVRSIAKKHRLIYVTKAGKLGRNASEATAREARYEFLNAVKEKYNAKSIITAHHQDDLIETALINMLRGTGPRGLSSMKNNPKIIRPLLIYSKEQIISYTKLNKLKWHEDETNQHDDYLRNYIRHNLVNKLDTASREMLINNLDKVAKTNMLLDAKIATLSHAIIKNNKVNRDKYIMLPNEVGSNLLMYWLRCNKFSSFNEKNVIKANLAIKTASPGTIFVFNNQLKLKIGQSDVTLVRIA